MTLCSIVSKTSSKTEEKCYSVGPLKLIFHYTKMHLCVLRSKEVCDNLPSNFDVSDIPMVVYNLNPSIRSTFFNYKQFVLYLNVDEFLKDPNSIQFCCNKYDNSFINNHYGHNTTGNLNIFNNESQLISKGPQYREPKQICFEEAREEIQTGIDQLIERISNDKGIHKNHFSEWKSHVMSTVNEKIRTLKSVPVDQ